MDAIRVVIADDHPVFRFGMRALLDAEPGTAVVGEATTGDEAVALASSLRPGVMIIDLNMPGCNGIEATRRTVELAPEVAILVVTMFEDDDSVFAAMRAGARGYLLKGAEPEETVRAIRAVSAGEAIFSPAIARRLMQYFGAPPAAPPQAFPELTEREREVLRLIAEGYSAPEIGELLAISAKTVDTYKHRINEKLGVAHRTEYVRLALRLGILKA